MSQVAERLLTADEFFLIPEPKDGSKLELAKGRIVTFMPAGYEHGRLSFQVAFKLWPFIEANALGDLVCNDTGFVLQEDPADVRGPDVAFVSTSRSPTEKLRQFYRGAPDLAIEVISPSDEPKDIQDKVDDYIAAGTPRVWLLYPEREVVVVLYADGRELQLHSDDVLTSEHAGFGVDGFELRVAQLFA